MKLLDRLLLKLARCDLEEVGIDEKTGKKLYKCRKHDHEGTIITDAL